LKKEEVLDYSLGHDLGKTRMYEFESGARLKVAHNDFTFGHTNQQPPS